MTEEKRLNEYRICQVRGHSPMDHSYRQGDKITYVCKYCGTHYRVEHTETLIEENKPEGADD